MCIVRGLKVFPIVYFMMVSQTEDVYMRVLQYVRQNLITWHINSIYDRFRARLDKRCQKYIYWSHSSWCWFHFCQVTRQIQVPTHTKIWDCKWNTYKKLYYIDAARPVRMALL
ncbi:uncharacterized protein LOC129000818 [Macrosteles quadrilineatus]|uniref:uncharacterized protein LOC129000818 n=1 Tax=Macrosteles quadrilineatus TaxID=74068 RepID=UPI0023E120B6|nr:uncharacterized protein LOC129000818 [Macrosteles quadrilineatus]